MGCIARDNEKNLKGATAQRAASRPSCGLELPVPIRRKAHLNHNEKMSPQNSSNAVENRDQALKAAAWRSRPPLPGEIDIPQFEQSPECYSNVPGRPAFAAPAVRPRLPGEISDMGILVRLKAGAKRRRRAEKRIVNLRKSPCRGSCRRAPRARRIHRTRAPPGDSGVAEPAASPSVFSVSLGSAPRLSRRSSGFRAPEGV